MSVKRVAASDLVRVEITVSAETLYKILESHESHIAQHEQQLNEHDAQIADILRRIGMFALRDELDRLRDEMRSLKRDVAEQMQENARQMNQWKGDLNAVTSALQDRPDPAKAIEKLRGKVRKLKANGTALRDGLQEMVGAYGAVTGTPVALGQGLATALAKTTETLRDNLVARQELQALKDRLAEYRQDCLAHQAGQRPMEIDIDQYSLREGAPYKVGERPELPLLRKWSAIDQSVGHFYKVQPRLQNILNAFNDELCKLREEQDNSALRELMDKIRALIQQIAADVEDLKKGQARSVSRAEVTRMMGRREEGDETAVGAVRCIACGRDMQRVVGAVPEEEARRALGRPANQVIVPGMGAMPLFDSVREMERSMESPRGGSGRPSRRRSAAPA